MSDEDGIRLAIEEAKKSQDNQGAPIGAVMVKNGEIIATGWSLVWPHKDPSSHAETNCIKTACKNINSLDLTGCTLYGTLESCSMCLACGSWAGLSKVVFGAFKEDIGANPYEIEDYHAEEWGKKLTPLNGQKMEIKGGVLREECKRLMKNIENWSPKS